MVALFRRSLAIRRDAAPARCRGLLVVAILLVAACAAPETPVAFRTPGGEAWTFDKQVEASLPAGDCDTVALATPRGTVIARPIGDRLVTRVPLDPGENLVRAECRRDGARRGGTAEQRWIVRLGDAPTGWPRAAVGDTAVTLDAAATELAPARAAPIVAYEWRARAGNPAPLVGLPASGARVAVPTPTADGDYYIALRVTDAMGRIDDSTVMFRVRQGRAEGLDPMNTHPLWVDRAVVYGAAPFFFGKGCFQDVAARLDELAALGVTVLWLPPVTATPADDFGYAVIDHFRLRPTFGSETAFRALIAAAHARGMKVIIDFVPNHLSERHPYYADVAARPRSSPYTRFFARGADGRVTTYFDWDNLKNLNFDNPEVQTFIIEAFVHWVREFDVDGFRVDAAWGPRQRTPGFWPRWRAALKRIKPDLLLLAEAPARDAYYGRSGFDAAYDWGDKIGEWAWRDAFDDDARTASRLRRAIARDGTGETLVFRFLNNNDTGPRFIARYGLSRTRVAAAMLLTLPGVPLLYTGDEIGASFEPYDEGPPLVWNDPHGLRPWYARLIALRHAHPALRSRALRLLDIAPADQVLAYLRPGATPGDSLLVLLNYGATPQHVAIPREVLAAIGDRRTIRDLLHEEPVRFDPALPVIPLPGHGVRILRAR